MSLRGPSDDGLSFYLEKIQNAVVRSWREGRVDVQKLERHVRQRHEAL